MVGTSRQKWIDSIVNMMTEEGRGFGLMSCVSDSLVASKRSKRTTNYGNLKIDKRFQTLGKTMTGSLMRNRSTRSMCWTRRGQVWSQPHSAK